MLVFQSTTLSDVLHIRALLHAGNMAYRIHARGSRRWGYALQAIPGVASSITTQALYEAMYLRFVPAERWDGGLITQRHLEIPCSTLLEKSAIHAIRGNTSSHSFSFNRRF